MTDQTMQTPGNPLNQSGLCLLSLDGGGVRGLSTLLILKVLMAKINAERIKDGQPEVKPCEIFDMIGGTSTGGIIAIMLGRLEMSVDECITTYTRMFEKVFGKKGLPVTFRGKVKGRFDSKVLEECIVEILKERGLPRDEPLINDKGCKVVVCAKAVEITTTVLFRSYTSSDSLNNIHPTICEAVRATSAATSFFDPVTIGQYKQKFVDGALGANNPVEHIWNEAQSVWCAHDVDLKDMLKCIVSLGTGNSGLRPISEGVLKLFSESFVRIATETEDTAKVFIARHRQLYEQKRYFRFNVQKGLQDVGLEEYTKTGLIEATTTEYMDMQGTKSASKECAMNLKQKKSYSIVSVETIFEVMQPLLGNHDMANRSQWRDVQKSAKLKHRPFTFMPLPRNNDFVYRSIIFEELNRLLPPNTSFHKAAIWGLGGSGKTQVALEYAYARQMRTSCSIFWVRADNEARFTQNYTDIARLAGLSPDLKGEELLFAVQQWIEQQENWLLVLDNVDNLGIFRKSYNKDAIHQSNPELLQFVPQGHGGSVIWTSRDGSILRKLVGPNDGIEVKTMDDQEAIKLFQKLSGCVENQELVEEEKILVTLLDRLPLAITQAAAYIRKTKISTQYYIKMLTESETRQVNILSNEFDEIYRSDIPNSVMSTWLISMKQISEESPNAEMILNTISFFDNQGIPFKLLRAAVPELSEDETLLAASRLIEYAFLQVQKVDGEDLPAYEQHRLVQLAARHALTDVQTQRLSGRALEIMSDFFPDGTHETWPDCRLYLPHASKAVARRYAEEFEYRAPNLLARIGRYYWEQGRSDEAEKLNIEVLELRKTTLGEGHPDTILAMANLASTWQQQGRYDEAEKGKVEVLKLRKNVLGERHLETIRAMANLASTWWQQGRSDEAEKLNVEVLELRKTVLGERHPDTILAMANLASTWWQQGRSDEAEKLEVEVLELRKTVLGERHPDTILAMANLASTWQQQGWSDEAEKLEVEVLELRKTVLGEGHPDTIRAMANLASIWRQQGRSDEAEKVEVEVLELRKNVLREKHLDTILAIANLAST